MALLFRNRATSARRKQASLELMMQARVILKVEDDAVVSVSEHSCGDPECGRQTVILVMRPRQPTEAIKIGKPLETVTSIDLCNALAACAASDGPG
jgi:hypothetical protein